MRTANERQAPVTYDESPIDMPTSLPFIEGQTNKNMLAAAWKAAGLRPQYPCSTVHALSLVKLMGYSADNAAIGYCIQRYMDAPKKQGGQFQWEESDVIAFADCLERLRRWVPLHPSHVHKLTPDEYASAHVEAAKKKAALEAFTQMHPNELINLLVACEEKETREMLAFALKLGSGLIHIRGDEQTSSQTPADEN